MGFITLLLFDMIAVFIALVLYVLFGQITVRRLRKNPETKHELGMEFASGWDILNVAGALALPRWLNRYLRNTPLGFLYANADLLDRHTSVFDRILASIFYFLFMFSGIMLMVLAALDSYGFFDK